jgi:hypothetical protein
VPFFADDCNEFWDYDQIYWLLQAQAIDDGFFEGNKYPSDAFVSKWVPLTDLDSYNLHAVHKQALKEIL